MHDDEHAAYQKPFYLAFRRIVERCVTYRKSVIVVTVAAFALSIFGFGFVQQQFFPDSTRPELLIDLRLPQGASIAATEAQVKQLEGVLAKQEGVENFVSYVGTGSPRFYLPLDQQLPNLNFAQFVVTTKSFEAREELRVKLIKLFDTDFSALRANIRRLENGPPVGFPVQFRVSGPDIATVRKYAKEVAEVMRGNPNLRNVQFDWDEMSKVVKIDIDQNKARILGVSSQEISNFLNTTLDGLGATAFRERDKLVEVLLRAPSEERASLARLGDLELHTRAGQSVPLAQLGNISYGFEEGVIWRRNLLPTITVSGNI
jgi:multidrug efflux pump